MRRLSFLQGFLAIKRPDCRRRVEARVLRHSCFARGAQHALVPGLALACLLLAGCGPLVTTSVASSPAAPGSSTAALLATGAPTPASGPVVSATAVETPLPAEAAPAPTSAPATAGVPSQVAVAAPLTATVTPTPAGPDATRNPNLALILPPTELPTPDPEQAVGAVIYEDDFAGKNGWAWPYAEDDVAAFSLGGNRLNAVMKVGNVAGGRIVGGAPTMQIGDQQLQVTSLTNLCYPKDEYGVLFRVNTLATDGYLFKLSCEGKARVEVLHSLRPAVLADWTASPAIVPGAPAENTLLVWAAGDQLRFFVNGRHLFSVVDKTFVVGTYGFYVLDRSSGGESVSFDHLVVKAVSLP